MNNVTDIPSHDKMNNIRECDNPLAVSACQFVHKWQLHQCRIYPHMNNVTDIPSKDE